VTVHLEFGLLAPLVVRREGALIPAAILQDIQHPDTAKVRAKLDRLDA
jgi:hypothetical protein